MSNEERKGTFYVALAVITLLVSIAGASFAYFTAAATPNTTTIKGQSNDAITSALTLTVERANKAAAADATSGDNLVPADFGVAANAITTTLINNALTAKCVKNGYTGCHVWKISAKTTQAVASANIKLSLSTTKATANTSGTMTQWSYAIYTGTDTSASAIVAKGGFGATPLSDYDMHAGAALTATTKVYYLMVYIRNENASQNAVNAKDVRGSYSGSVTFTAGGGQVKTSFTS